MTGTAAGVVWRGERLGDDSGAGRRGDAAPDAISGVACCTVEITAGGCARGLDSGFSILSFNCLMSVSSSVSECAAVRGERLRSLWLLPAPQNRTATRLHQKHKYEQRENALWPRWRRRGLLLLEA